MPRDWMEDVCDVEVEPEPTVEDGLEALNALLSALQAADRAEGATIVAAWIEDPAKLRLGVVAMLGAPTKVMAILTRIGALRHGFKRLETLLLRELKRFAEQLDEEARSARAEQAEQKSRAREASPLGERLDHPHLPDGLCCPSGWELEQSGLYRLGLTEDGDVVETLVAHRPLLITGRLRDITDGATSLRLEWPRRGGWQHRVVARAKVMEARALVALAGHDAPVTSNNAASLVQYLADFEAKNATVFPEARVTATMGWQGRDGADGFLWGRSHLQAGVPEQASVVIEDTPPSRWTAGGLHLLAEEGAGEIVQGFRQAGTREGWCDLMRAALPYPRVMLALYASAVPPLLQVLHLVPNFILDFCGETSGGKTTAARGAASLWGSPDEREGGLVRSWDATRVWIERTAGLLSSMPLILDDTRRARRPEEVGKTLYDFANGIGRGRGSVDGTRTTSRWRSVLISTGEAPATSFSQEGGTRARCLTLWGSPFGGDGPEQASAAQRITQLAFEHHGHAGPALVRWMLDTPDAADVLRERYAKALERWTKDSNGNGVAHRAAGYVAALAVAGGLLHEVMGVSRPEVDPLQVAWAAVCEASKDADRAADALRDVLAWATGQQERFWGRGELDTRKQSGPTLGWLGSWPAGELWNQLAILPTELSGFLARLNYDGEAVLRTWDTRGWLSREEQHRTKKVVVGERKVRCVVLTRAACDLVSA